MSYRFISYVFYLSDDDDFTWLTIHRTQIIGICGILAIILVSGSVVMYIILPLPPDDELVQKIDHVFERGCSRLHIGTTSFS